MVFRKKEIIAASLVVLIGMAGYLNWSYQDTIQVTDGESYIETGKKLGEAQYVANVEENVEETDGGNTEEASSEDIQETVNVDTVSDNGGYFEQAKLNRETARSKSIEILTSTAENESFDAEIRKKAGDKIIEAAGNTEKEMAMESIAQSKGYAEICVYLEDGTANIMVRKTNFGEADVVKLTEIATETLNISSNNIKIVEVR